MARVVQYSDSREIGAKRGYPVLTGAIRTRKAESKTFSGSTQKFSHRGYFVEAPEAQEEEEGLPCRPL